MKLIITTCPEKDAEGIADLLLAEKLAACVNISGLVKSKFWWKGKIDSQTESVLLIKTRDEFAGRLMKRIKEIHAYEVPEIVSLDVKEVDQEYLAWIEKVTQ